MYELKARFGGLFLYRKSPLVPTEHPAYANARLFSSDPIFAHTIEGRACIVWILHLIKYHVMSAVEGMQLNAVAIILIITAASVGSIIPTLPLAMFK